MGTRADIGITPVESIGTITTTAAMIASAVNAVAIGHRLFLRAVDEDSSRVSPNIFSPPMKCFDTGQWEQWSAKKKIKRPPQQAACVFLRNN
jgi:hypothetical protein